MERFVRHLPITTLKNVYEFKLAYGFLYDKKRYIMNLDKDQNHPRQTDQSGKGEQKKQRSSAFKETSRGDEKSTTNIEGQAAQEQQRKETLTERD
jgi:hypothetical protein